MTPLVSVIISAHNPHPGRLQQALAALRAQTLPSDLWETLLVDNASEPHIDPARLAPSAPANLRVISEPSLGLTSARRTGIRSARGSYLVLVDDDNVLAPDYLRIVADIFERHARVGAAGGKSVAHFESEPLPWQLEFLPLLAVRDLGGAELLSQGLRPAGSAHNHYPSFAPIGAGMALRREACEAWLGSAGVITDRRGSDLSSGGDNDIVFCVMEAGWEVAYVPALSLEHLIPATRLEPGYLARLNRGIQKSWMQVLARHGANPWEPLSPFGGLLRKARAYVTYRAWADDAAHIRWQGACGHFDGRVRMTK